MSAYLPQPQAHASSIGKPSLVLGHNLLPRFALLCEISVHVWIEGDTPARPVHPYLTLCLTPSSDSTMVGQSRNISKLRLASSSDTARTSHVDARSIGRSYCEKNCHRQASIHRHVSISKGGGSIFVGFHFHGCLAANSSVGFRTIRHKFRDVQFSGFSLVSVGFLS